MTIETRFSSARTLANGDYLTLFSYHIGGAGDEIEFALGNNGAGIEISGSYIELKNYNAIGLLDGGKHQLSLTWDSPTGAYNVYVDGTSVASGTGLGTGYAIRPGGVHTFGQEQDTRGGGFDKVQLFQGTLHDVRVFNDVRTPAKSPTICSRK